MKNIIILSLIFLMMSCNSKADKIQDKWKSLLLFLLPSSSSPSKVNLNLSLIGADGKPMSVSNASTRSTSSAKGGAEPAENSNVGGPGSSGQKAGGESVNVDFNGSAKAVEVYDSNGGYAGTISITPRTGNETNANSFLSFALASPTEIAAGAIQGVMAGDTIVVDVPFSDRTKLTPIFTHDGASVLSDVEIITGQSTNNFSSPVKYTVKAKDGTTKTYTIVTNRVQYTCELAGIYFTDYPLAAVVQKSDNTNTWYEASLPPDTNLASLKTSFSAYGTSMTVGAATQTSGVTPNNFNSPVTFTVNGSNGCTSNYVVRASTEVLAAGKSLARGTLDLVDIPAITKVEAIGVAKSISSIETKAFGYFDDILGEYIFTKGRMVLMVPWGTPFENINLGIETKNNTTKVFVDNQLYVKGQTIGKFTQRNGSERHTVDVKLVDKYTAFEVPYSVQIVLGAPPPFLAVSRDANFMLFINSNAAGTRDDNNDLANIIKQFAPYYNAGSTISDLKTILAKVNESALDTARWTIDPGKVELNLLGKGYINYDYDIATYEEDLKCLGFPEAKIDLFSRYANSGKIKDYIANETAYLKSLHSQLCGSTKNFTSYPNTPRTYPRLSTYGSISKNLGSVVGYGLTKSNFQEADVAYTNLEYIYEPVNQDNTLITLNTKKGLAHTYDLPAVNYIPVFTPYEGTVGTEITASLGVAFNPSNYSLNCSMDKVPVLNQQYVTRADGLATAIKFNVPYTSKGTRITCERLPINGIGSRFIMLSSETFQMRPYKELKGLSYGDSPKMDFIVGVEIGIPKFPILESGKASYYRIKSGKVPAGMNFFGNQGVIAGRPMTETPASELVIEANDGYKQVTTTLTISASLPPVIPAPTLNYPASGYSLLVGKKFTINPIVKGTDVRYSIDRPLPTGVSFDRQTGIISGYPTSRQPITTYIIMAANQSGFMKFTLSLQIIVDKSTFVPPTVSFSAPSLSLTRNQSITIPVTSAGSAPFEFSAVGLPEGMIIDSQTGILSGTPSTLRDPSDVVVTIQNYGGVARAKISMSVTDTPSLAPFALAYSGSPFTFTNSLPISAATPTYTGILSSCASSPALPTGLLLSSTCQITGTPTATVTNQVYSITGSNSSGATSVSITITTGNFPPSSLVYSGSPYSFSQNTVATVTPTFNGGVLTCTSAPALPAGLAINNSTCAIGGTPTVLQGATSYTITATNPNGNTTAVISIAIVATAPSALTYVGIPYSFFQSQASSSGLPTYSGSPLSSCTSAPALPAGLTINNTNCTISGTPTSLQGNVNYTITATNGAGNTTAIVGIAIVLAAPNNLLYVGSPFNFLFNTALSTVTPTFTSTITSCSASPPLPAGLTLSNSNCAISGTPTALQAATSHTITASNGAGSNNATISITVQKGWYAQAYLKQSANQATASLGFLFGRSVSISGDTIVVGTRDSSNQTTITNGTTASADTTADQAGAAYVYKRTGVNWAQEAYLKAPNAEAGDIFGFNVSVSVNTIVVGAAYERSNQTTITNGTTASANNSAGSSGAAYVFKRTGVTWTQEAYLKASNAEANDNFGWTVAIDVDTIVVGATSEASNQTTVTNGTTASANNSLTQPGAAYVFKRTGANWAQEAYLKAPNAESGDQFGNAISLSVDTIVVGAGREESNQTTVTNGTTASADNSSSQAGAAYVFKRTGVNWAQEAYLKASNANIDDVFGLTDISISGDSIVVGAYLEDSNQTTITNGTTASADNSLTDSGAAYVFKRTGVNWAQEAYLKAPNADTNDTFGIFVSISGDTIVVVARQEGSSQTTITNFGTIPFNNSAANAGAAYIFKRTGVTWAWEAFLKAPNADVNDFFGSAVAIDTDTVVVGATGEDSNQRTITNGTTASANNSDPNAPGAAYVFIRK